ncbi:MAG: hypothetical protein Homavirus25_5 [Homavirus sp.]|uniref:Uncharacterized protein n=1 Tax=Homavirus sp. TaxID=2487769 RepID=A0A3G5A7U4_9VIRU|nr:MAG: hypothetical protein Homavirus25_5 [Homavirus sp.]
MTNTYLQFLHRFDELIVGLDLSNQKHNQFVQAMEIECEVQFL